MKMKRLILVRHANAIYCSKPEVLSGLGVKQAQSIAEILASTINNESVILLSSDLGRAIQTAEIIGKKIGIVATVCSFLHEDSYEIDEVIKMVKSYRNTTEVLVLVMHHPQMVDLSLAYDRRGINGVNIEPMLDINPKNGCAVSINCETGERILYTPNV